MIKKTGSKCKNQYNVDITHNSGFHFTFPGFLEILALGIFTDLVNDDYAKDFDVSYKWAYAVGWLSAVITIISAILTFVFGGEGLI